MKPRYGGWGFGTLLRKAGEMHSRKQAAPVASPLSRGETKP